MQPIFIDNISLYFPNKICFENFSAQIYSGARIAIIGNNGSGKSTLLKIINGDFNDFEGEIRNNKGIVFGYVPQMISDYGDLSGGEKFNKSLSAAFSQKPDILLLDEPTNHLDAKNRKSLMKMINNYLGAVIIVSHDEEVLRNCIDTFWHIDNGIIKFFSGKYDDYIQDAAQKLQSLKEDLRQGKKDKKAAHKSLMKEQERAKHSKERGEKLVSQKRWLPAVGDAKQSSASKTAGKKRFDISGKMSSINEQISNLYIPEIIKPKFSLNAANIGFQTIVSISAGGASYGDKKIFENLTLSLMSGEHIAVSGDNGCGKTTLFKAILNDSKVTKSGIWDVPDISEIGYLDQHYNNLSDDKTVFETISELLDGYDQAQIRDFLNDFLFRKNEEVNKKAVVLSGGERARLSLAKIAAKTPKLLLLDEITNNIDLETKAHVIEILRDYP
ncbi:MAG: ATP-binding cassette domain-containing protein, partial [Elusimicrobiota bacterium]|nr:ATP-binding cassette domain-containing protein [Elusimicrobiota bacterium]